MLPCGPNGEHHSEGLYSSTQPLHNLLQHKADIEPLRLHINHEYHPGWAVRDLEIVKQRFKSGGILTLEECPDWEVEVRDQGHGRGFIIRVRRVGEEPSRVLRTEHGIKWRQARDHGLGLLADLAKTTVPSGTDSSTFGPEASGHATRQSAAPRASVSAVSGRSDIEVASPLANLEPLLLPLNCAVADSRLVVAMGMWRTVDPVALLPFQLHGEWCDKIPCLALGANFSMVPFTAHDWAVSDQNLFDPATVKSARLHARSQRSEESRALRSDFVLPDWEHGYSRHRVELQGRKLPPNAYLSIDIVRHDGTARRSPRPVLGRYALRSAPRQWLRVPGRDCSPTSIAAVAALGSPDLLLVNLQDIRGERTSALVRAVLHQRGADRPTLIVASSPSDLLFLKDPWLAEHAVVFAVGQPPSKQSIEISLVGRERPQQEREFDATLRQLQGSSDEMDRLVKLGISAWWAANQSLSTDPFGDHAIRRFFAAVERFRSRSPIEAEDLNGFRQLLLRTLDDGERIEERLKATVRAVEEHVNMNKGDAVVVVRQPSSARIVKDRLAAMMGCDPIELPRVGIVVRAGRALVSSSNPGIVVSCGFSGYSTIDALLASRAPTIRLVIDPVEAALAASSVRRIVPWLERAGVQSEAIAAIAEAAFPVAVRGGDWIPAFTFDVFQNVAPLVPTGAAHPDGRSPDQLRLHVRFTDGDEVLVEGSRRFERVDPPLGRSRSVPASALMPGDEVILAEETELFSDLLIKELDRDVLADQVLLRKTWVMTVSLLVDSQKLSIANMHRALAAAGVNVDYQTVRAWTRPTEEDDRVPARWEHFHALAAVVGLLLSDVELRRLFDGVRILRVRHRKAGRDLVRMLRAARTGQLDAASLRMIESLFGLGVRDLVDRTRIAVVDDIQPEI
jgi:hypothetical protein